MTVKGKDSVWDKIGGLFSMNIRGYNYASYRICIGKSEDMSWKKLSN
jgi:hypothetical protein